MISFLIDDVVPENVYDCLPTDTREHEHRHNVANGHISMSRLDACKPPIEQLLRQRLCGRWFFFVVVLCIHNIPQPT